MQETEDYIQSEETDMVDLAIPIHLKAEYIEFLRKIMLLSLSVLITISLFIFRIMYNTTPQEDKMMFFLVFIAGLVFFPLVIWYMVRDFLHDLSVQYILTATGVVYVNRIGNFLPLTVFVIDEKTVMTIKSDRKKRKIKTITLKKESSEDKKKEVAIYRGYPMERLYKNLTHWIPVERQIYE